jgi:F0F1-type ATP synthase membrane subunit b/b'
MPIQANNSRPQGDFESAKNEIAEKLDQGKRTATEALHDARDEVTQKVGEYTSEAKEALFKHAEGTQRDISSNLLAFGGALRAASEHLANSDQRTASKFVLDAAGGMERLSSSLKDKPFEEVLEEIRTFGRDNSGALIAGSVLAGLALGRFVKSTAPSARGTAEANGPRKQPSDAGSDTTATPDDRDWNSFGGEPDQ